MCEFCEKMEPLIEFSQVDKGIRHVKTYIEKSFKGKEHDVPFYCLTTKLNTDGNETTVGNEVKLCPMCGRKLSEVYKMNKSDLEKTQKCQGKYEKYLKESHLHSVMDEIAKDIRDRQDNIMAMEFTRTIAELLRENGIVVYCEQYKDTQEFNGKSIEVKYGVRFDSVDCTKHDKKFTDRIAELEEKDIKKNEKIQDLAAVNMQLQVDRNEFRQKAEDLKDRILELESELSVKENLLKTKNGLCREEIPKEVTVDGFKCEIKQGAQGVYIDRDSIYEIIDREKEPIKKKCAELEDRHQSDCITINQLHTALDVMTEKYQKLKEIHGL